MRGPGQRDLPYRPRADAASAGRRERQAGKAKGRVAARLKARPGRACRSGYRRATARWTGAPIAEEEGGGKGGAQGAFDPLGASDAARGCQTSTWLRGRVDESGDLRAQAKRCRRLAEAIGDDQTIKSLRLMADDYDARAIRLDAAARSAV